MMKKYKKWSIVVICAVRGMDGAITKEMMQTLAPWAPVITSDDQRTEVRIMVGSLSMDPVLKAFVPLIHTLAAGMIAFRIEQEQN